MVRFLKGLWRALLALLGWALGRSPYGHQPHKTIRVIGPDGKPLGDSAGAIAYVSRHGLHELGVICPCCGLQAARPGDWSKVTQTNWGDAICCSCGRMLLASPDDDVDPVTPKKWYDPEIYHRFARPVAVDAPKQRTLTRAPQVQDWVVIRDYKRTENGVDEDLDGAEGRVVAVEGQAVMVQLVGGIGGVYGQVQHLIPLDRVHVMIFDALRKGDRVNVIRGARAGNAGVVKSFGYGMDKSGLVDVQIENEVVTLPVERLEKIHDTLPA